ncbi:MAG: histidinol dehydrogenase [Vicinamibacteria bacterium]|nr:histidinol dehydrogenase [Vicinamibacteria bacterium]
MKSGRKSQQPEKIGSLALLRAGTPAFLRFVERRAARGASSPSVDKAAAAIVAEVRARGDAALVRFGRRFDGVTLAPAKLKVRGSELRALARRADPLLVRSLRAMAGRIEEFHRRQKGKGFVVRLADGSVLEELVRPLDSAGLYVPGGAGAYPSSVLMNAIPARVAGVARLVVATPPRALEHNPAVAAALEIAGVSEVYRIGGAQAIAALAYGTARVAAVDKIVGPGNAWVAAAKRLVRGRVETDADAGPSEVAILADETADAGDVAADLLAQAEHGSGEECVVLVTTSRELAEEVARLVDDGVARVANPESARRALERHGAVVLARSLEDGIAAMNALAAEHAEVITRKPEVVARQVIAGAVFAGPFAPVAVGDYGIGPNHVLPTGGAARRSSPLSVRDFERRQSLVVMSREGLLRIADDVVRVAAAEGFHGHAMSVMTRFGGDQG